MAETYDCYDVVIIGAGPAGLTLAACLARWGYKIRHIDNRPHPTLAGRADGIQPRSMDLMKSLGLKAAIMAHEPAKIFETAFWTSIPLGQGIFRSGTSATCPRFIGARHSYTTLLHQGRIESIFISDLEDKHVHICRPWTISDFGDNSGDPNYPLLVKMTHVNDIDSETVKAKYLFGAEGSRSLVKKQLKINTQYKETNSHVWAVIDGVVKTSFPDIRMSCSIQGEHGSIMIIPREDDMVRLYVQLSSSNSIKTGGSIITELEIQDLARKILHPYLIEWDYVEWFSVYAIQQGVADSYSLDQRIFLGGDACHTHSPKAGQGMNTAFMDSLNLAWKIHMVESGFVHRDILKTYEHERRMVAKTLIDFDYEYAKLYSQQTLCTREDMSSDENTTESALSNAYRESRAFVSGFGIQYGANVLNWSPSHPAISPHFQKTEGKLGPGQQFITADVIRVTDANIIHLEQAVPFNGSFRIFLFGGEPSRTFAALHDLSENLCKEDSFYTAHLRPDIRKVSFREKHNPHSYLYTFCIVFSTGRQTIDIAKDVPGILAFYRHHVYVDCFDNQVHRPRAHLKAGFSTEYGGVVVVRPDGYVGAVISLVDGNGTAEALNKYFSAFSC